MSPPALLLLAAPLFVQGPLERRQAPVRRLPAELLRPRIDGVLDDPAWAAAEPIGELVQVEPVAGAAPSERTEVRILYDERSVFLSILCFDREPEAIRATQMKRDAVLDPDDRVEVLFDPFLDRRNAFWFQIGAAGSKGDALVTANGASFNKRWDGIWHGAARVTERGWEAEMEIPVQTINFDPDAAAWGFNLRRFIRRRSEEARWASPLPRIRFFAVANAGVLAGFEGLRQGLGLDVVPFAVADGRRDRPADDDETTLDGGFDAFWRPTPFSKLSASVNTDFAETEVDERRVNLTRFPLFFPEKRDFFLEDSGFFFFGGDVGSREEVVPFFSRRIGLDARGGEVPLLGALKYTGQTGRWGFGLLDVQTDDSGGLEGANLFAGRLSRHLFERSDAGVIWTHGNPTGEDRNDTYGADFNYRTDRFLRDRNLALSTWILRSDTEGVGDGELAYALGAEYPNDEVELSLAATVVEESFQPALGFVRRTGIVRYDGRFAWRPRPYSRIRQLRFELAPTFVTDTGHDLETAQLRLVPLGVELESGDEVELFLERTREVLDQDFDIQPGVVVPAGGYGFTRAGFGVESSDRRPLSARLELAFGEFFDGERDQIEVGLDLRASRHALFGVEYEHNDVHLPAGDFTVDLVRLRAELIASPELAWSNFLQWDDQSDGAGLNSRLWWILEPGREVFAVWNQGWDAGSGHLRPEVTQLTLKVGYTFRF